MMSVEKEIQRLNDALQTVLAAAEAGRGGSSGQRACSRLVLALADDQPCDMSVLRDVHGELADAVGVVISGCLDHGSHVIFDGFQERVSDIKTAWEDTCVSPAGL
jgi:hypothetical protein